MYAGKVLIIDLTENSHYKLELPQWLKEKFLGGVGFLAKILLDNIPKDINAFEKENVFGISSGPANGEVLFSGRFVCASLSPLTDAWGETHLGGDMGMLMKANGYDAIFIKGEASEPVNITIDREKVRIERSREWGKKILEAYSFRLASYVQKRFYFNQNAYLCC